MKVKTPPCGTSAFPVAGPRRTTQEAKRAGVEEHPGIRGSGGTVPMSWAEGLLGSFGTDQESARCRVGGGTKSIPAARADARLQSFSGAGRPLLRAGDPFLHVRPRSGTPIAPGLRLNPISHRQQTTCLTWHTSKSLIMKSVLLFAGFIALISIF